MKKVTFFSVYLPLIWDLVALIVGCSLLLVSCGQLFSTDDTDTPVPTTPPPIMRDVDLSVVSTGLPGFVNITFHYGSSEVQYNGQAAPWTYSYTPYKGDYISIQAKNLDDNGDVTITVTVDGSVWRTLTSYGPYCEVSTSGWIQ